MISKDELKLLDGGRAQPSPPEPKQESYRDYAWMFAVAAIIWGVIGYWIFKFVFR